MLSRTKTRMAAQVAFIQLGRVRRQSRVNPTLAASPAMTMPAIERSAHQPSPIQGDVLRLHELHHALVGALAAEPALLGAAEGRGRIRDEAAVEADHAEIELLRHAH